MYGDGDVIGENGELQWEWLSRPYDHRVMTSYHFLWNDFTNYIMQQATFWRRRVHDRIGYFDDAFHFAMDAEYWIRAGHAGLRLVHIPRKLGKFRLIEGTKSLSSPTVFWGDYLEIFRRYRRGHAGTVLCRLLLQPRHPQEFHLGRTLEEGNAVFERWAGCPHRNEAHRTSNRRGFKLLRAYGRRALRPARRRSGGGISTGASPWARGQRSAGCRLSSACAVGPAGPHLERLGSVIAACRSRRSTTSITT